MTEWQPWMADVWERSQRYATHVAPETPQFAGHSRCRGDGSNGFPANPQGNRTTLAPSVLRDADGATFPQVRLLVDHAQTFRCVELASTGEAEWVAHTDST